MRRWLVRAFEVATVVGPLIRRAIERRRRGDNDSAIDDLRRKQLDLGKYVKRGDRG